MVFVETYLLRGRCSYEQTEAGKIWPKVVAIKSKIVFESKFLMKDQSRLISKNRMVVL